MADLKTAAAKTKAMTTTTTNRLRDLIFAGDLIERKCWNCKTQFHEGDYKTDN